MVWGALYVLSWNKVLGGFHLVSFLNPEEKLCMILIISLKPLKVINA